MFSESKSDILRNVSRSMPLKKSMNGKLRPINEIILNLTMSCYFSFQPRPFHNVDSSIVPCLSCTRIIKNTFLIVAHRNSWWMAHENCCPKKAHVSNETLILPSTQLQLLGGKENVEYTGMQSALNISE